MTVSDVQQEADPENGSGARDQPTTLSGCIASLTDAISVGIELEIERNKLDSHEFAVLQLFSERNEWTATQLVERLPLDPSRMSRLVAKLVDRRLLRRRRARTDRRVVMLTLTEKGIELMSEVCKNIESYESVLLKDVSKNEMAGFYAATYKILDNQLRYARSSNK